MSELTEQRCLPCEAGVPPLSVEEAKNLLAELNEWSINAEHDTISKTFQFKGYGKTMAFVNAVAWIANKQNHHPDMLVTYNTATVSFTTHAINGLSKNDFICAAKVDEVFDL